MWLLPGLWWEFILGCIWSNGRGFLLNWKDALEDIWSCGRHRGFSKGNPRKSYHLANLITFLYFHNLLHLGFLFFKLNYDQSISNNFIISFNYYVAQLSFSFQTISKAASFSSSRLLSVSMANSTLSYVLYNCPNKLSNFQ